LDAAIVHPNAFVVVIVFAKIVHYKIMIPPSREQFVLTATVGTRPPNGQLEEFFFSFNTVDGASQYRRWDLILMLFGLDTHNISPPLSRSLSLEILSIT
jgi:hypothetical protein